MASSWFTSSSPLVIGHRRASAYAPENTIQAFMLAVDQGADGIELAVLLSTGGVPCVIHKAFSTVHSVKREPLIERTTRFSSH